MAKTHNPFAETDFTKLLNEFKVPGVDVEDFVNAQQKNLHALNKANQLAVEGLQAVAQRQAEILRDAMQEMASISQDMLHATSPQERVAKQTELAKDTYGQILANMKELSEMLTKSQTEAFDVINKRVNESLDDFRKAVEHRGGKAKSS